MQKKIKVLLVEDNSLVQMLARLKLQQIGCDITVTDNGKDALFLAQNYHYDLIFMDIGLPDMDGCTVTEGIRKLPEPYSKVPVVALTAYADIKTEERAYQVGMNEFFIKPLTTEMVYEAISQFIAE
jgi:CheY-like chemotaxis protein